MKMALQGNTLRIKDADNVQFTVIKSWNKMRWVKKLQELQGDRKSTRLNSSH